MTVEQGPNWQHFLTLQLSVQESTDDSIQKLRFDVRLYSGWINHATYFMIFPRSKDMDVDIESQ